MRTILPLLVLGLAACDPAAPITACGDVPGSCMVLTVTGTGTARGLQVTTVIAGQTLKMGSSPGNCDLPCNYRIRPPAGLTSTQINNLHVTVIGATQNQVRDLAGLSWPEGAHLAQTIDVGAI